MPTENNSTPPKKKSNTGVIILIVVAVVLLLCCACCVGGYFFVTYRTTSQLSTDLPTELPGNTTTNPTNNGYAIVDPQPPFFIFEGDSLQVFISAQSDQAVIRVKVIDGNGKLLGTSNDIDLSTRTERWPDGTYQVNVVIDDLLQSGTATSTIKIFELTPDAGGKVVETEVYSLNERND